MGLVASTSPNFGGIVSVLPSLHIPVQTFNKGTPGTKESRRAGIPGRRAEPDHDHQQCRDLESLCAVHSPPILEVRFSLNCSTPQSPALKEEYYYVRDEPLSVVACLVFKGGEGNRRTRVHLRSVVIYAFGWIGLSSVGR